MIRCPKCHCRVIVGPRYRKTVWGSEYLEYRCGRCGYLDERPTHDNDPEYEDAVKRQLPQHSQSK